METLTGRGRLADRGRRLLAGASQKGHVDGNVGVAAGAPGRGGATNPADRMPAGKREGAGWRNPKVDVPKRYRRNNTKRVILSVFGRCLVLHPKSRYQRRGPFSG